MRTAAEVRIDVLLTCMICVTSCGIVSFSSHGAPSISHCSMSFLHIHGQSDRVAGRSRTYRPAFPLRSSLCQKVQAFLNCGPQQFCRTSQIRRKCREQFAGNAENLESIELFQMHMNHSTYCLISDGKERMINPLTTTSIGYCLFSAM